MARSNTTVKFQILEFLNNFVDDATANAIGKTVVDEAKDMMASGQSPVRGIGRYKVYSDAYKSAIKTAKRGAMREKTIRPVNLHLTGEMLDGYGFRRKSANSIEIGMVSGSTERKEIAEYHQKGTRKMPARPLVPGENEEWAVSIMRAIRDAYGKRLRQLIERSNKK